MGVAVGGGVLVAVVVDAGIDVDVAEDGVQAVRRKIRRRKMRVLAIDHQWNRNEDENKDDEGENCPFAASGVEFGDLVEGFGVSAS